MLIKDLIDIEKDRVVYEGILAHVSVAFIYNDKMVKEIEQLYETDKYEFYKKAVNSPAYNHVFITMGGIEREFYAKKALGIIIKAEEDEVLCLKILQIIRRHFSDIYNEINKGFNKFMENLILLHLKAKTPTESKAQENMAFYIVLKSSKEFIYDSKKFIEVFLQAMYQTQTKSLCFSDTNEMYEPNKEVIQSIKTRILKDIGEINCFEDIYNSKNEEIFKYQLTLSNILEFEKMSISALISDIHLSEEDINRIILAYTLVYKDKNLERTKNIYINGLIILALIKSYKNAKEVFFKNNQETLYFNMQSLENKITDLDNEKSCLKEQMESIKKELDCIGAKHTEEVIKLKKQSEKEISTLNKEIRDLKRQLEQEKNKVFEEELYALRETVYTMKNEYIPEEKAKDIKEYINTMKVLIIGGAPEWRKKIKEKYPSLLTLDGLNENFDINIMNNVDAVFFYFGYMNHGTYYKAINFIRNHNVRFGYIGKTNVEQVEKEIIEVLRKQFVGV